MNACCETPVFEPPVGPTSDGALHTVVLIGPPNSGKSTLFNRLTGLRQKVANYPGVTVEQRMGPMAGVGRDDLTLIDLPGVYSLTPYSEDARVAVDVLRGKMPGSAGSRFPAPDPPTDVGRAGSGAGTADPCAAQYERLDGITRRRN
jgi:ferrous iron transport protein B